MHGKIDFLSTTKASTIKLILRMMSQTKNKRLDCAVEGDTHKNQTIRNQTTLAEQKDNWPKPSNLDWTVENTTFQLIHTVSRNTPFVKLVMVWWDSMLCQGTCVGMVCGDP